MFLDTAPLVYFVEANEHYLDTVRAIFRRIDEGSLSAVTSPITLAECLVMPYRKNRLDVAQRFLEHIVNARNTTCVSASPEIACKAAEIRARYNLSLDDAFQIATALASACDGFLTNDRDLKRVVELDVIVLDE
ncbi:MAG: type II toxin-antitoxin system VapC family toxin [Anaerolineae bacterium]